MDSRSYLIAFFLLLYITGHAQDTYDAGSIPSHLKERAHATVREEKMEIEMKSANNVAFRATRTVTIHNHNGDEHGAIDLFYNKARQIKSVKGEVYNEFGIPIGKFSLKDFSDRSASGSNNLYDDIRVKHFHPTAPSYPYTISYTVDIRENQSLSLPVWRPDGQYDVAIESSTYTFSCAPTEKIRIQQKNINTTPTIAETPKTKTYTWTIKDRPARRSEPYSPPRHEHAVLVRIVPENFQYFKRSGSFSNWEEFGKWKYDNLLADKRQLPATTVKKVQEMTKTATSPKEKTKILYQYLQEKTRYISIQIGIGGLEPFSATSVDQLGYGDCKALVNYMQALLDVVDIPSYYCVVEAGNYKQDISTDFANVTDGNHIILCLPFENDTTWLECTNQHAPFGFLGDFTDDRLVLACTADGGKLLKTPRFDEESSSQYREAHFTILENGSLEGKVTTVFKGAQLDNHYHNAFVSRQDQLRNLQRWYNIDNISFRDYGYAIRTEDSLSVTETLDVHIKNFVVSSDKYAILHPNIFNIGYGIPATRNRTNSVYINRGYTDVDVLTYTLPDHVDHHITPLIKKLETPMGSYELRISVDDGILTSYRKIQLREGTYPSDTYGDFHEFMTEVSSADRGKYTLPIKKN